MLIRNFRWFVTSRSSSKKVMAMLAACSLLSSCKPPEIPHSKDPFFDPYLTRFKQDADQHQVSYPRLDRVTVFTFGSLQEDHVFSECQIHNQPDLLESFSKNLGSKIKMGDWGDTYSWAEIHFRDDVRNFPTDYIYRLFLHEIGHCVFNLGHNPDPNTIMYAEFLTIPMPMESLLDQYFDSVKSSPENN